MPCRTHGSEIYASEIEIRVSNQEVTLTGSVDDRQQKRAAEDLAENVSGVREVHNNLRVSKGIGQRMGEALGLGSGREGEENRNTRTTTTNGQEIAGTRR